VNNILWLFSILVLFVSMATSQTQRVPADVVARLCSQAPMTSLNTQIPGNDEYVAAALSNGSAIYTMVGDRGATLRLPLATILLLHTHPYNSSREPRYADKTTAKNISAPNCAEPLDVPAVQEKEIVVNPHKKDDLVKFSNECISTNGKMTWKPKPECHYLIWTCAEKSRILETSEDGNHWCRKVQPCTLGKQSSPTYSIDSTRQGLIPAGCSLTATPITCSNVFFVISPT